MEPPESDAPDGEVGAERPKSTSPPGTPPGHHGDSDTPSEQEESAACEECENSLKEHKASTDSPAAEWIASIAHAQHHDSGARGRRRPSGQRRRSSASGASRGRSSPSSGSSASHDRGQELKVAEEEGVEVLRPKAGVALAAGSPSARGTSTHRGIGKKDLEEMRRQHSETARHSASTSTSTSTSDEDRVHDWGGHAWRERPGLAAPKNGAARPRVGGGWVKGKDGRRARAEYELGGTEEHPVPRIRLFVESPVCSDDEDGIDEVEEEDEQEGNGRTQGEHDDFSASAHITELPESPRSFTTIKQPVPPPAPLVGVPLSPGVAPRRDLPDLDDDEDYDDEDAGSEHSKRKMRSREIVIPLTADTEFLDTLTGALANLSTLQSTQRDDFVTSTENLCSSVARVSSPYASKNDMYVWREIFSLWVEMQIFESEREKDRGELSVDESEARLKRFAEELSKRGWTAESAPASEEKETKSGGHHLKLSKRKANVAATTAGPNLPMKDPRSIKALEDFLRLNLVLLDVKKFQRVNVEAARKILKKHDKRTALTASSDLGQFMARQEQARTLAGFPAIPGAAGSHDVSHALVSATHPSLAALLPTSTTALLSQSLPHILLSLLTTTLLPILPSIDDYSCAICTGVAWRPIRLDCTHLFCIRCLVKLQKKNKVDCPLCRAKGVVGSADGRNLDQATINFLKAWFPKEVAEKEGENESERRKEEMQELGLSLENERCIVV